MEQVIAAIFERYPQVGLPIVKGAKGTDAFKNAVALGLPVPEPVENFLLHFFLLLIEGLCIAPLNRSKSRRALTRREKVTVLFAVMLCWQRDGCFSFIMRQSHPSGGSSLFLREYAR